MIVRKKRHTESQETLYIEPTSSSLSFASNSTGAIRLSNVTSMQITINKFFNSSFPYMNQSTSSTYFTEHPVTHQPDQFESTTFMTSHLISHSEGNFDDIMVNETLTSKERVQGNDRIQENLIWGIDNTVGVRCYKIALYLVFNNIMIKS